jgi:lysophospholipase L1-like esterase
MNKLLVIAAIAALHACNPARKANTSLAPADLTITGRALKNADSTVTLIASASSCIFTFEGKECTLYLKNIAYAGDYNYINIEIDGQYGGRQKVDGTGIQPFVVKAGNGNAVHTLVVSKATEASNGQVVITKITGTNIKKSARSFSKKIEFIGNSITCGFGNDLEIPCGGTSKWYDQHNAYWSYASITARGCNAEYMISAISGAGIYRVWNMEGPSLPQQYENTFLNTDSTYKWDFSSFTPDIVTIALGTNDISDGDGVHPRPAFDKEKFIAYYKRFIKTVYHHYPAAQLVLLNSPMVSGEKGKLLEACINTVKDDINKTIQPAKAVQVFFFRPMKPGGCGYHPSIEDDKVMANQLTPFIKSLF